MHYFTIFICETQFQLNDNLMTQFNEGKECEGVRTIKSLSLKIQEATSKCCDHREKKENKISDKQYIRTKGIYQVSRY